MKRSNQRALTNLIVIAGLSLPALPSCGNGPDDVTVTQATSAAENGPTPHDWYRRRPRTGTGGASTGGAFGTGGVSGTGGTSASGGSAGTSGSVSYDCSICDQANLCCQAVTPAGSGPCSFSSSACRSYTSAESQNSYALYCLAFIRTVMTAWQPQSPPAVCLLGN